MFYQFNDEILSAIKNAFTAANVKKESNIIIPDAVKQFFVIEFQSPVELILNVNELQNTIVHQFFAGDNALISAYGENSGVTAGIRWVGDSHHETKIHIIGFAFSVVTLSSSVPGNVIKKLLAPLLKWNLITELQKRILDEKIKSTLSESLVINYFSNQSVFFARNDKNFRDDARYFSLYENGKELISNKISAIEKSDKIYPGENSINPAFENLAQIRRALRLNEKKIWLLRSDFILALGVKNAYQDIWGYYGLDDAFDAKNHRYIDWNDRVGHPSLAISGHGYDGRVYYAGHVAQRDGYLELLNYSGRYDRLDLTVEELIILEAFVALQFQNAFGKQKVVFITNARNDYRDYYELSLFYSDKSLPSVIPRREYTVEAVAEILSDASIEPKICFAT